MGIGFAIPASVAKSVTDQLRRGERVQRDPRKPRLYPDPGLVSAIQPGIDNQQSVAATLGRPTFTSQFGQTTWYYVSSVTGRRPFVSPTIREHSVLAVSFDAGGNVVAAEQSGLEKVVYLDPDGDETPTLGRERGFFEDLFGNIGQVGAAGVGGGGPGT